MSFIILSFFEHFWDLSCHCFGSKLLIFSSEPRFPKLHHRTTNTPNPLPKLRSTRKIMQKYVRAIAPWSRPTCAKSAKTGFRIFRILLNIHVLDVFVFVPSVPAIYIVQGTDLKEQLRTKTFAVTPPLIEASQVYLFIYAEGVHRSQRSSLHCGT